jgi:hypothetical protein
MVYLMNAHAHPGLSPPPQRRRAIIIGAGPIGLSTAFHLGEHCLLLERRPELPDSRQVDADNQQSGVPASERKALFITCRLYSDTGAEQDTLIHVARWQPPELTQAADFDDRFEPRSPLALVPLLRGEFRLGARVVCVSPAEHLLELADGSRFIYDKLLCTLSLCALAGMVMHEFPGRIRSDESLRYWLSEHDIQVVDHATQVYYGDLDDFAVGKRIADEISEALAEKFRKSAHRKAHGIFRPRLVRPAAAPAMS